MVRGLYQKYVVYRKDRRRKPNARYFVLDYGNDPIARSALRHYAIKCLLREEHRQLGRDLLRELEAYE